MQTFNLYCKRCGVELHIVNAQKECGELVIVCSICEARNVLAPYVFDKIVFPNMWRVVGWRD